MSKHLSLEKIALQSRRTKIVATLGPASNSSTKLDALLKAGVNVVRLNMSHGDHQSHRRLLEKIRTAAKKAQQHVAIIMDLCGPKIRVGEFPGGNIQLHRGKKITVTCRKLMGDNTTIPSQYLNLYKDVSKADRILLDDGNLELKVLGVTGKDILCRVVYGGILKDHKGMNLPDSNISAPSFTNKDKRDALFAMENGVDFIALSFVRSGKDVKRLSRYMKQHGHDIPIISKIEKPEAITNIDEILDCSYGIMIARGDLGIELPAERVPLIQQDLIQLARSKHVPVIVATQMLESMITHSRPTRAEVGDVANAALLGADAVMLSGETASGQHPVAAVQIMNRILREIERKQWKQGRFTSGTGYTSNKKRHSIREAIAHASVELARDLKLQSIVIPTLSGTTARIIAAHRTTAPMIGVCGNIVVCRRLSLHWGIIPVHLAQSETQDWRHLCSLIGERSDAVKPGYSVLIVAGFNDDPTVSEPVLKIVHV